MNEKKMTYIEQSIEINAPVEKVLQYAADWENWPKFFEGVYDFRPTTETTRGTGARYAYKAGMLGMKAAVETEIHDFVENKGWKGVATKGMKHQTCWIFEEVNGKTKFTYGLGYWLPVPILGGILDKKFMKPAWERIIDNSLQNLKKQLNESVQGMISTNPTCRPTRLRWMVNGAIFNKLSSRKNISGKRHLATHANLGPH
ncbi:MAG: SRPBCC family protein [Dehalococcoidia bacterium]|nr:MAG: SRPBCC family protein [Dehalococcoidia bacterium]